VQLQPDLAGDADRLGQRLGDETEDILTIIEWTLVVSSALVADGPVATE